VTAELERRERETTERTQGLSRFRRTALVALAVAIGWGLVIGNLWKAYCDPLTGFGLEGYAAFIVFHASLAGTVELRYADAGCCWRHS